MGDGGFFRGTSANQDARFLDKQKKLKAQMKFDSVLETKVSSCLIFTFSDILKLYSQIILDRHGEGVSRYGKTLDKSADK